jgi:hypothetical protein
MSYQVSLKLTLAFSSLLLHSPLLTPVVYSAIFFFLINNVTSEFASLDFPRKMVAHFALSPPFTTLFSERQQGFRQTRPSFSKMVN